MYSLKQKQEMYEEYKKKVNNPHPFTTWKYNLYTYWLDFAMKKEIHKNNYDLLYIKYKDILKKNWVSEWLFRRRCSIYWINDIEKITRPHQWRGWARHFKKLIK